MFLFSSRLGALAGMLLLLVACGCAAKPAITAYTVKKDVPDRLLGGILLQEDRGWFFKLTGPREQLDEQADNFRSFLKSLKVTEGATQPTWTLPEGWEIDPTPPEDPVARQMRVATIKVPLKSGSAELAITTLGRSDASRGDAAYVLENINRWRGQMGQARMPLAELKTVEQIDANGNAVYLVSIAGRMKAGGMSPPFAGS